MSSKMNVLKSTLDNPRSVSNPSLDEKHDALNNGFSSLVRTMLLVAKPCSNFIKSRLVNTAALVGFLVCLSFRPVIQTYSPDPSLLASSISGPK